MTRTGWVVLGALGAGFVVGGLVCRGRPANPAVIHEVDSVLVAGPPVHDTIRVATAAGQAAMHQAAMSKARADTARRAAESMARVADSLASVAHDSGAAYEVLRASYDSLGRAHANTLEAWRGAVQAASQYYGALVIATQRVNTLETTLRLAGGELKRAKAPSRITLGAGAGYGGTLSGGTVHTGPTLALQVNYRIFPR